MSFLRYSPEFQSNPLPTPDPLALLLKNPGTAGSGKGSGDGKVSQDKRRFLYRQGIDQLQDERNLEAMFDMKQQEIAQEAIRQKEMSPVDYITRGPGAQKLNSFLSEYYAAKDHLRMRSQYLQDNEKYYQKFIKEEYPKVDPNEPIDINEGKDFLTRAELLGDNTQTGILPATYQEYLAFMHTAPADLASYGVAGTMPQLTVPKYEEFQESLRNGMKDVTGMIEGQMISSGITGFESIGDKGAFIVSFGKGHYIRSKDKNGKDITVSLDPNNETALNSAYALWMASMTPDDRRVYNKLQHGYVLNQKAEAIMQAAENNKQLTEDELAVIEENAKGMFDDNLKALSVNTKLKVQPGYESWQQIITGLGQYDDKYKNQKIGFEGIVSKWTQLTQPSATTKMVYYKSGNSSTGSTVTGTSGYLTGKLNLNTHPDINPALLRDTNNEIARNNAEGNVVTLNPSSVPYVYNEYGQILDANKIFGMDGDKLQGQNPPVILGISGQISEFLNPGISNPNFVPNADGILDGSQISDIEAAITQDEVNNIPADISKKKYVEPAIKVKLLLDSHTGDTGGDSQADSFLQAQFIFDKNPNYNSTTQGQVGKLWEKENKIKGGESLEYAVKGNAGLTNHLKGYETGVAVYVYVPQRFLPFIDNLPFLDNEAVAVMTRQAQQLNEIEQQTSRGMGDSRVNP